MFDIQNKNKLTFKRFHTHRYQTLVEYKTNSLFPFRKKWIILFFLISKTFCLMSYLSVEFNFPINQSFLKKNKQKMMMMMNRNITNNNTCQLQSQQQQKSQQQQQMIVDRTKNPIKNTTIHMMNGNEIYSSKFFTL